MIAHSLDGYKCVGRLGCCIRYECACILFILVKGRYAENMCMAFVRYLMHMQRDTNGVPFVIFGLVICIAAYFLLNWSIGRLPEPARMIWYSMRALAVAEIVISPIRCARDGVPLTLRTETAITIRCPLHSM